MEIIMLGLEIARRLALRAGPYLVIEILLPGGTLLALLLYLYRRRITRNEALEMTPTRSNYDCVMERKAA
jgi:hypothetical protein